MHGHMSRRMGNNVTPAIVTAVSLVAIVAFVMGGTSFTGRHQSGHKMTGSYTVTEQGAFTPNRDCTVDGVRDGTPVAIRNAAGEVVRVARLTGGIGVKAAGDTAKASQCRFEFVATKVPVSETYEIRVGAREPRTVTRADLHAADWHVDLT